MAGKIRLQKILSEGGVCSRRAAEVLIAAGRVRVNGRPASLGDGADPERDRVTLDGVPVAAEEHKYVMLNKPRGYVTTLNDERGRRCVADLVAGAGTRLFPVGRLDRDSEGLLIMTNDGEFANKLAHPSGGVAKVYRVTVRGEVTDGTLPALRRGAVVEGKPVRPREVALLERDAGRAVLKFTLTEGLKREIRVICAASGLEVARLQRVAVGPLTLGSLPPGKWRYLTDKEVRSLTKL